jgi:hypothetical protein
MRKPLKGDGVSCGVSRCDENIVTAVVVGGETDVVTGETMGSEGSSLAWCFVKQNFGTWYGKRGAVEVEITVDASVGRDFRLTA